MADSTLASRATLLLAVFACACGGSSQNTGEGGADSGGASSSNGAAGSNGLAGSGGRLDSGSGSSGAGNGAAAGSGSTCPAFTPCGGSLVGDWTVEHVCLSISTTKALTQACSGASFTVSPLTATGTVSFKADNTMTSSALISFQESLHYPAICFTEAQCMLVATQLSAATGVSEAQCGYDAVTGCSCTLTSSQATMGSGTYAVQGTNVTMTNAATGRTEVDSFCVSGNQASFYQVNANGITSSMTVTK